MSHIQPPPRLETYLARRLITLRQYRAAVMWYGDWIVSGRGTSASRPDRQSLGKGEPGLEDIDRLASRKRYKLACHKLGTGFRDVAQQVTLHDVDPTEWAEMAGMARQTGMDMYRLALDIVANAYALPSDEVLRGQVQQRVLETA